jgi:hypothetical protein
MDRPPTLSDDQIWTLARFIVEEMRNRGAVQPPLCSTAFAPTPSWTSITSSATVVRKFRCPSSGCRSS